MQEESANLRIDITLEEEGSDVGEGHDGGREEQEEHPDALVVLVEDEGEHDDEADRDVGHHNIKDNVRRPVSG